jgi:glycosyltransferase involved in cell wall biosynthesis
MKVVSISDVTVGYGSPQLPLLTRSLVDHYHGEGYIVEPAQPELLARHGFFPDLKIRRIATAQHPHSEVGRTEYVWRAIKELNELRPDVLVICCTYCLPVLFRLKHRPKLVIYYSIESIPFYGLFDLEMNRYAGPLVDVVIFPEENRAVLEVRRCGFHESAKVILYNCVKRKDEEADALPAAERNGRILYAGTIHRINTLADFFLQSKMQSVAVDLFGPIKSDNHADLDTFMRLKGNVSYRGYLSSTELAAIRKRYAYSVVMWNPLNENQYYAAPNKFFESIADGVPPIAAPHPQCKLIIDRYSCGILMRDWTFESFYDAVQKATAIYGTSEWDSLVDNCLRAVREELTWTAQFEKLKPYLRAE